jgi:alkylhydroperoxidase family enzyme
VARIPLVDPGAGDDPRAGQALSQFGGLHPNVFRAIANHPGAVEGFAGFAKLLYFEGSITPAQRELAYLTASVANRCHY